MNEPGLLSLVGEVGRLSPELIELGEWLVIVLFVVFAGVAGLIWPQALSVKTRDEIDALKVAFPSAKDADYLQLFEKHFEKIERRHYRVPTALLCAVVLVGSYILVKGTEEFISLSYYILSAHPVMGDAAPATKEAAFNYAELSLLAMQSGFLGAFLWSLQHLIRRAFARDINPTTIYHIAIQIMVGVVAALMVRHLLAAGPAFFGFDPGSVDGPEIAVFAFLVGLDPLYATQWITDWIENRGRRGNPCESDPARLRDIEGIGKQTEFRLQELWLEDAYALANANPINIYAKTPFSLEQAIAWVGQGQLLGRVQCKAWREFASRGLPTSVQVYTAIKFKALDPVIESMSPEVRPIARSLTLQSFESDLSFLRLAQLVTMLRPAMPAGASVV